MKERARMRKMLCVLLVLLLLLPACGLAETKTYPVPNLENAHLISSDAGEPAFQLSELGEANAGGWTSTAYAITPTGQNSGIQKKWTQDPEAVMDGLFQRLEKENGQQSAVQETRLSCRDATVNGTSALLYTYPNGGRVLVAPELSVVMIEAGYGLYLEKAVAAETAKEPSAPQQSDRSGTAFEWRGSGWPKADDRCFSCGGTGICQVCYGRRRYYVTGYGVTKGTYVNCAGCDGTGKCAYCTP